MKTDMEIPEKKDVAEFSGLNDFFKKNPHAKISKKDGGFFIEEPWGYKDLKIKIDPSNQYLIDNLNAARLDPSFDAIIHTNQNLVEFIFTYVDDEDEDYKDVVKRNFTLFINGHEISCYYDNATEQFLNISKFTKRVPADPGERSLPQIDQFIDAHKVNEKDTPSYIKKYFEGKRPISFYLKFKSDVTKIDLDSITKNINFIMHYYDRETPQIEIKNKKIEKLSLLNPPIRYIEEKFPEKIILNPVDDVVLKLLDSAKRSNVRFAIVYYYQVLEYAAHYYIEEKTKNSIRNMLKDPSIISCGEDKFSEFYSLLIDTQHEDKVKLQKIINDSCDPKVVWKEIENNKTFFSKQHTFEGGFTMNAWVNENTDFTNWKISWANKITSDINNIRNALVHVRERRENKVILPTAYNNSLLIQFRPIFARLAEQLAIKT